MSIPGIGEVGEADAVRPPTMMEVWRSHLEPDPPSGQGTPPPNMDGKMGSAGGFVPGAMSRHCKEGCHDQGSHGGPVQPPPGAASGADGPPGQHQHSQGEYKQEPVPAAPTPAGAPAPTPSDPPPAPPVGAAGAPAKPTDNGNGNANGTPAPSGVPGVTKNPSGIWQANPIDGVNPNAVQVKDTGTGSDKVYNVTNMTNRDQSFVYSTNGQAKGMITLKPGETGAFKAGSMDLGVRITPTDAAGNAHTDEVLYEDGGADNGQGQGVGNADISKVDGDKDAYGVRVNMTVTLSNGRTAGDGDAIHAYQFPTDDAASMGLAGDPSKTASIVLSDA